MEEMKCKFCGRKAEDIEEYIEGAMLEGITPEEYVEKYEFSYNSSTGIFVCTDCHIVNLKDSVRY